MKLSFYILPLAFLTACAPPGKELSESERNTMQMAENAKQNGNLAEAAALYQQVAASAKTSVEPELELAAIDRKMGRAEDAVSVLQDAQKRQPDNQQVIAQLGYALSNAGRSQEAVAAFDRLIAQAPDNAAGYTGKAVAFDKSGNHLAAQELYKQALAIAPDSPGIENNLAMSLIMNNQLDAAIAILEKLNLQSDNKTVRQNLALAYGLKGNSKKALELNLKDLPPDQAKENLRYYEKYAAERRKLKTTAAPTQSQIGFSETPGKEE